MQTVNIIKNQKRKSFAAHSLKTKHVNRISPPSVILGTQHCILFIYKISNNNIKHTVPDAGLYVFSKLFTMKSSVESYFLKFFSSLFAMKSSVDSVGPPRRMVNCSLNKFNIYNLKFNI